MEVLWGSALLLAVAVLLCEGMRALSRRKFRPGLALELCMELVCTLQLCCCVRELALLGARGVLHPLLSLCLTYLLTMLHSLTCPAACNPCSSLQLWLRGEAAAKDTALRVGAQLAGAQVSRLVMPLLWSCGLSPLHRNVPGCESPLRIGSLPGAGYEMFCALCLYLLLCNLNRLQPPLRPHLVAALITSLVYTGGHLTGAVFNPALAFSIVFSCEGNTLLEYMFVYWLGPVIGKSSPFLPFHICSKFLLSTDEAMQDPRRAPIYCDLIPWSSSLPSSASSYNVKILVAVFKRML
uniref:Aquaporin 11 n=1 Tax=Leptobrachium leishanense TaxID=445787 RepID=A0A8C5LZ90_9ANUR